MNIFLKIILGILALIITVLYICIIFGKHGVLTGKDDEEEGE